jgi:tetratricopeptide (TPR) repeat protein
MSGAGERDLESLQAEALGARARGEHGRAAELWRALLEHRPEDWVLALELKRDLKAGLHYPESDGRFRRAARFLPDAEWLAHYTALYAYHGEDLDALDARAQAMLARMPRDHRLWAIRGDVASQRRDWAGAEQAFAEAYAAEGRAEYAFKRETARMYRRVAPVLACAGPTAAHGSWTPLPSAGEGEEVRVGSYASALTPALSRGAREYAVAFVNLDRNPERAAELRRQFAGSAPALRRVPGIEGRRLAAASVRRLGGDPGMRGTLGCFLSHAGAWEAMLDRGDALCLFIEDDVIPLLDLPPTLDALGLPAGFDLVFVNDRIAPRLDPAGVEGFTVHTLAAAMTVFHPEDNAPGGDGYVLSAAGARKLLAWVEADGFAEDVDWRLIAYGLTPEEIAALPRPSHAGPWLDRMAQLIHRPDRLRAYVLHPPLIRTVGVSSDREDENRLHAG